MQGRILTVTESDPCSGSGIQSDIKTAMAMGGYATTAITAITIQNANMVSHVQALSGKIVAEQMRKALDSIGAEVIKIGTLYNSDIINHVVDVLEEKRSSIKYIITDPEMVTVDNNEIMDKETIDLFKRRLLVMSNVITPNRREAELLTGMEIKDTNDMRHAADMLHTYGAGSVVLKGGHITSSSVVDLVVSDEGEKVIEFPIIGKGKAYGAGTTISTAIAVGMAMGLNSIDATDKALSYLNKAISSAHSHSGPINHGCNCCALDEK